MPLAATTLLDGLNAQQREAVEAPDGPLLIFAGAGSGKTRVLTHRIAYVMASRHVHADEICAVTFTNKAAREMRARVEALVGESIKGMWLGTFHAMGARMLRRDGDAIGIPRTFTIYDEADRLSALRRAMRSEGVDEKRYPPTRVGHAVSMAKNELIAGLTVPALGTKRAAYLKVTTRSADDWPALGVAVALEADGSHIRGADLFISAATEKPIRLRAAEAVLRGADAD